jgi:hypothetical protein
MEYNNGRNHFAIENTTKCGGCCCMCPRDNFLRKHGKFEIMPLDFFKYVADQCVENGIYNLGMGCYGDPISDPHFAERLEYIKTNYP